MRTGSDVSPALLAALRRERLDSVEGAFAYGGGDDLVKPGLGHRRRTRLTLTDAAGGRHELYLKRYHREALPARLRRWWTYGIRTSPAEVEFDNIEAIRAAGVGTMQAVACGSEWGTLDARRSYLLVTAVPGRKLDDIVWNFVELNADRPEGMWTFTLSLAAAVRRFHEAGFVHRDMYACHVFLDESSGAMQWRLIDVARVFAPRWRRVRWRVKDLAQLVYSMPRSRWTEPYWPGFLRAYLGDADERTARRWDRLVQRKVAAMRRRNWRKQNAQGQPSK